jgi:hypothetical protein
MIWDYAASLPPQVHFFLNHHPHYTTWEGCAPVLNLTPHRESGARTQVDLSRTCSAARAAVARQTRTFAESTSMSKAAPPWGKPAAPSVALDLDLTTDLVCFGGPDGDGGVLERIINCGQGRHALFRAARRFAVRFKPSWANPVSAPWSRPWLQHDVRCPGRWVDPKWAEKPARGFCSSCLRELLAKFAWLDEFYLILDEADLGNTFHEGERGGHWGRRVPEPRAVSQEFHSFGRTYFTLDVRETDAAIMEACGVLEQIRADLVREKRVDGSGSERKRAVLTSRFPGP